jgi:hypothetical protein
VIRRCLSLAAAAALSLGALAADPLIDDALLARAKAAVASLKALDEAALARLPAPQALEQMRELSIVMIEIGQAAGDGNPVRVEQLKKEMGAGGLDALFSDEIGRKAALLRRRVPAAEQQALERELAERYPAYGNYLKRAAVSGVMLQVGARRFEINDRYASTRQVPASLDAEKLRPLLAQKGVRSATYRNGAFRVVLNEDILAGGVIELAATPRADGTLDWRCTSSADVRHLVPQSCRQ